MGQHAVETPRERFDTTDVLVLQMGAFVNQEGVTVNKPAVQRLLALCILLAADLHEMHDATGISLDNWANAREFVEAFRGPIVENHA